MSLIQRVINLFSRERLASEIDEELQFHVDMRVEENISKGMSPVAAKREAISRFGNPSVIKENVAGLNIAFKLDVFVEAIRLAFRRLVRAPFFAITAILILALGIGAAIAVFTVFNALVIRPLPLPHPEQLVQISGIYRNNSSIPISYPMFAELERKQRAFSGICGWSAGLNFNVEANGSVSTSAVHGVTGDYYTVLGVIPLMGRLISPTDVQGNQIAQVAVIGYEFWKERFGGDPAAVGKNIRIDGKLFTIVGVTRRWFTGMIPGAPPEITIPAGAANLHDLESRSMLWLFVTGRLKEGTGLDQSRTQFQTFWPRLLEDTVPTQSVGPRRQSFLAMRFRIDPASAGSKNIDLSSKFLKPLYLLSGIVSLILLVVCVNLASLTLASASARRHEISTRIALGATPWQAIRQFVIESLFLSTTGALSGLLLALWGSRFLVRLLAKGVAAPVLLDLRPDWRVCAFAAATAVFTGLFIGLIPAWKLSRQHPATNLRSDQHTLGYGVGFLGKALIVAQIAISLVLLQASGLFLRTLKSLRTFNPGFERSSLLEARLTPQSDDHENLDAGSYRRQLLEAMTNLPSIRSAAFSNLSVPSGDGGWKETTSAVTDSNPPGNNTATLAAVSPGFFKTLAIPLMSGRDFTWFDNKQHPAVAIIDSLTAKSLFPSVNPIGKHLRFGVLPDFQNLEIVGVAQNARILDIRDGNAPVIYVSILQLRDFARGGTLILRGTGSTDINKAIVDEVRSFNHEYATAISTFEERTERSFASEQMTATLSTLFAYIALLVAGFGLFGLMLYAVTLRTREIGVRMAMGSQRRGILHLILRDAVMLTLAGIAVGIPFTFAATHLIAHMIFGLSPADSMTLAESSLTMLLVGMLAGYWPALKAMKMNPVAALRHD
jgi:predicted permease